MKTYTILHTIWGIWNWQIQYIRILSVTKVKAHCVCMRVIAFEVALGRLNLHDITYPTSNTENNFYTTSITSLNYCKSVVNKNYSLTRWIKRLDRKSHTTSSEIVITEQPKIPALAFVRTEVMQELLKNGITEKNKLKKIQKHKS